VIPRKRVIQGEATSYRASQDRCAQVRLIPRARDAHADHLLSGVDGEVPFHHLDERTGTITSTTDAGTASTR
jgi:hypothetical protein